MPAAVTETVSPLMSPRLLSMDAPETVTVPPENVPPALDSAPVAVAVSTPPAVICPLLPRFHACNTASVSAAIRPAFVRACALTSARPLPPITPLMPLSNVPVMPRLRPSPFSERIWPAVLSSDDPEIPRPTALCIVP